MPRPELQTLLNCVPRDSSTSYHSLPVRQTSSRDEVSPDTAAPGGSEVYSGRVSDVFDRVCRHHHLALLAIPMTSKATSTRSK